MLVRYYRSSHKFRTGTMTDRIKRFWCMHSTIDVSPGNPLMRVLFTLHHDLQVKEPFLQKTTMMSMKVHVSLLPPIYRNFYRCVEKIKIFKHFDVAPPVKLCAPVGLPARRRRNYRANKAPYVHTELRVYIRSLGA